MSGRMVGSVALVGALITSVMVSGPGTSGAAGPEVQRLSPAITGANWPQLGYGPDRSSYQPNETTIGTANVGSLSLGRTYTTTAGGTSAPLIVNGILYVDTGGDLFAFDATGATDCSASPTSCTPLWTARTAYFDGMTIGNGDVFATDDEGVQAFDASGSTNCSGAPKVCSPLWSTSQETLTGPSFTPGSGSPVFDNGVLYVPGYGDGLPLSQGGAYVAAFDAAGSTDCSGTPAVCTPMWTTAGLAASKSNGGSPAIANGVLYIADGTLFAFDAAGSTDCSGTPAVCNPMWIAPLNSGDFASSAPSVSNGTVFVGGWYGGLYAFDAAGSTNCSTTASAKTCAPLWTANSNGSIGGTPAVANGVVYTVAESGALSAFDAAGSTNCSTTASVKTCTPLWTSTTSGGSGGTPAVANGVVYMSTAGGTYAFDAAGLMDCSGTPTVCSPLWGGVTGLGGSPAVVNGVLYINSIDVGSVYAYVSAQLTTPTRPTISNIPTNVEVGGSFSADVTTNGDGTISVATNSSSVCRVNVLLVTFLSAGTCSLTASVTEGTTYAAATGVAQTFTVSPMTSTTTSTSTTTTTTTPTTTTTTAATTTTTPRSTKPSEVIVRFPSRGLLLSAADKRSLSALAKKLERGAYVTCTGYAYHNVLWAKVRARVVASYLSSRVSVHVLLKHVTSLVRNEVKVTTAKQ